MKKVNWFKRLFKSWSWLENYFKSAKYTEFSKKEALYASNLASKDETLKQNEELIDTLRKRINDKEQKIKDLEIANQKLSVKYEVQDTNLTDKDQNINNLKLQIQDLATKLEERNLASQAIKNEIRDQLKTIGKIERTFFGTTGNKGKAELGEHQVKLILERSGLSAEMYTENLVVGKNIVEFAMHSGEEGKYIPIDSKVIEPESIDNKLQIDDSYKKRVDKAAKEITKYLGKVNTASYGILVLPNDEIYMELFKSFPNFFQEMIEKYKIYINSPSSFVQAAWSIAHLLEIYKKVHKDEQIYDQIIDTLESISKFANKLSKVHTDFRITMKHYNTISNKGNKLIKKLHKEDKITCLPELDFEQA